MREASQAADGHKVKLNWCSLASNDVAYLNAAKCLGFTASHRHSAVFCKKAVPNAGQQLSRCQSSPLGIDLRQKVASKNTLAWEGMAWLHIEMRHSLKMHGRCKAAAAMPLTY